MDRIEVSRGVERFGEARIAVGEETSVNVVLNVLKDVVMAVAAEVVRYSVVCRDRVKGSTWWIDDIKKAAEMKKKTKKKLQINVSQEINERRR